MTKNSWGLLRQLMLVLELEVLIILSEEMGVSRDDGWLKDV